MSNQTIHCHRGILSDDSALAQRMVFVQDELGLLEALAGGRLQHTARRDNHC